MNSKLIAALPDKIIINVFMSTLKNSTTMILANAINIKLNIFTPFYSCRAKVIPQIIQLNMTLKI
ncbi:MAG: hypothetical protein GXO85_12320 [Chlorobi bacterium]|nr:hypothetical protein [Chlorobiota bacterium]